MHAGRPGVGSRGSSAALLRVVKRSLPRIWQATAVTMGRRLWVSLQSHRRHQRWRADACDYWGACNADACAAAAAAAGRRMRVPMPPSSRPGTPRRAGPPADSAGRPLQTRRPAGAALGRRHAAGWWAAPAPARAAPGAACRGRCPRRCWSQYRPVPWPRGPPPSLPARPAGAGPEGRPPAAGKRQTEEWGHALAAAAG